MITHYQIISVNSASASSPSADSGLVQVTDNDIASDLAAAVTAAIADDWQPIGSVFTVRKEGVGAVPDIVEVFQPMTKSAA